MPGTPPLVRPAGFLRKPPVLPPCAGRIRGIGTAYFSLTSPIFAEKYIVTIGMDESTGALTIPARRSLTHVTSTELLNGIRRVESDRGSSPTVVASDSEAEGAWLPDTESDWEPELDSEISNGGGSSPERETSALGTPGTTHISQDHNLPPELLLPRQPAIVALRPHLSEMHQLVNENTRVGRFRGYGGVTRARGSSSSGAGDKIQCIGHLPPLSRRFALPRARARDGLSLEDRANARRVIRQRRMADALQQDGFVMTGFRVGEQLDGGVD
ncbi:hypothetical protein HWV62_30467 [Athelia sp. TMB]|nr:hypothetical protein HWV62_30467 [Athelia sp. TMB]